MPGRRAQWAPSTMPLPDGVIGPAHCATHAPRTRYDEQCPAQKGRRHRVISSPPTPITPGVSRLTQCFCAIVLYLKAPFDLLLVELYSLRNIYV